MRLLRDMPAHGILLPVEQARFGLGNVAVMGPCKTLLLMENPAGGCVKPMRLRGAQIALAPFCIDSMGLMNSPADHFRAARMIEFPARCRGRFCEDRCADCEPQGKRQQISFPVPSSLSD